MTQHKKNPNDPDFDQLNPEIVELARTNGHIKGAMSLYLDGQVTWLEALETMVLLITKEFRAQQNILVSVLTEAGPSATMMLSGRSGALLKALPPHPLALPEPSYSDEALVNEK